MQRLTKSSLYRAHGPGFTLIELLIVVAIIAILAAIAVPNFLEAQTRSKVSRAAADMRTIRTGLESYRVDTNKYPETDFGAGVFTGQAGAGMDRLTTPISYLTSVPPSPFLEDNMGGNSPDKNRHTNKRKLYLYVNAIRPTSAIANGYTTNAGNPADFDQSYQTDRRYYTLHGSTNAGEIIAAATKGFWELKSVGPNNQDDFHTMGNSARSYDPTNGTISAGDMVIFSDVSGFAGK